MGTVMIDEIFIVGAGAVGRSLALAWKTAGLSVMGIHDTLNTDVFQVGEHVGVKSYFGEIPVNVVEKASVLVLAIPFESIEHIANDAVLKKARTGSQIWLHTAGAYGKSIFGSLEKRTAGCGVLHPALAFPKRTYSAIPKDSCFSYAGSTAVRNVAQRLVGLLDSKLVDVSEENRPGYHAAMVMVSNYQAALLHASERILKDMGMDPADAVQMASSLAKSALLAFEEQGVSQGLTGPLARGEMGTIQRHLTALAKMPREAQLYRNLGVYLAGEADRKEDTKRLKNIAKILSS